MKNAILRKLWGTQLRLNTDRKTDQQFKTQSSIVAKCGTDAMGCVCREGSSQKACAHCALDARERHKLRRVAQARSSPGVVRANIKTETRAPIDVYSLPVWLPKYCPVFVANGFGKSGSRINKRSSWMDKYLKKGLLKGSKPESQIWVPL